jgi:hypothetical protein
MRADLDEQPGYRYAHPGYACYACSIRLGAVR